MARQLRAPETTVLPAVRANAGIEAWYRRQLDALVLEMHASIVYWLTETWKANEPELAQDATPANVLRAAMAKLTIRWLRKFNEGADKLAKLFADKSLKYTDSVFQKTLRDAGFAIPFTMTPAMRDVYSAVIGEQVGLIRSIAAQHLTQIETVVMQGVQRGRDLAYIHDELRARYGVTKRRAALISRDQSNKATATLNAARQQGLGIKQAIWRHSGAGKEPRPEHVKADGEKFDLSKGMYLEGEWVLPGQAINCRCTAQPIIPGFDDDEDEA
jgi:SPP1 gp7 family putative phage head morphogenesis protein